jgi:hypothetical protein
VGLNLLPYWLTTLPPRHLMPLVPFMALLLALLVVPAAEAMRQIAVKALIAGIGVAYVAALVGFPLYESRARGNYAAMARQIVTRAGDAPIYSTETSAFGLALVANINTLRGPALLVTPPAAAPPGYVLDDKPDPAAGAVVMTLRSGRQIRYLICPTALCLHP